MDFAVPSFSLGIDLDDDDPPPAAGSDRRELAWGYAAPDAPSFSLGFDLDEEEEEPQIRAGGRREEQARGYAALDAPSFSLGVDLDDDDEPQRPIGGRLEEQVRHYEGPDAPSFSLGIDDDVDFLTGGQCQEQAHPQVSPRAPSSSGVEEEDNFVLAGGKRAAQVGRETLDPDPLPPPPPPETNRFKRLRRGSAPPHPAPTPQVRIYEAPDAPSFSLGIDDDDDILAGGQHREQSRPQAAPPVPSSLGVEEDDDDFVLAGDQRPERMRRETLDPDSLPPLPLETTRLKRLRRGPVPPHLAPTPPPRKLPEPAAAEASPVVRGKAGRGAIGSLEDEIEEFADTPPKVPKPAAAEASPLVSGKAALGAVGSLEDEIEDFTDEERLAPDVPPSVGSCSTSSNSKFSLLNHGVLMSQSATKAKISKFTQVSNSSASKSLEESCTKKLLPKITISPMRKIYLLDSDTDADDDQNQNKAKKAVSPLKKRQESMHKYVQKEPTLQQNSKPQGNTTVRKCEVKMNDNWETPVLDDFCNEYFKSMKDSGPSQQKEGSSFSRSKVSQPNYSIGETERHFQHQSTSSGAVLDDNLTDSSPPAMHYFFHHDPMVRDLVRERLQHFFPIGAASSRENDQSRAESLSYRREFGSSGAANDGWVTPNRRIHVPTDVGKRRVHASGTQSGSGHWFTGEDGRKVYVSKNGQELTGRYAYRQYQKESGRGFNKYRKKGSSGTKRGAAKAKKATNAAKQGTSRAKRKR
ncbi:uncharacterized protein LOC133887713 [Phragmites australis]|uniref:uncharacterized protein LOC133887713 n=1 Tax=Phragmites australis TaxID=29695 RepID=UPI002D7964BC|nr:uncharacterized protein LOC133887713 [Phragmites australis]